MVPLKNCDPQELLTLFKRRLSQSTQNGIFSIFLFFSALDLLPSSFHLDLFLFIKILHIFATVYSPIWVSKRPSIWFSYSLEAHQSSTNLYTWEFLQQKYDQAIMAPRPTTLYVDTTIYYVNQIENLFMEFVTSLLHAMDHLLIWPGTVLLFSLTLMRRWENVTHIALRTFYIG